MESTLTAVRAPTPVPTHPPGPTVLPGDWSEFGCRVNAWTPAELFDRYGSSRFLYPGKRARLAPYWPVILDNWQRARRAGELLHWVGSYDDPNGGWASMTSWRSTHGGWQTQHLVSHGTLVGARAVMLAGLAVRMAERRDVAQQDWFSPGNRFAAVAFGGMVANVSPGQAAVVPGDYVMVPLPLARSLGALQARAERVAELDDAACPELAALASRCRGDVYVRAEGLDRGDLRLNDVDRLYRLVGLRRYRRIWAAYDATGRMLAAALAYRGPLGFNFSFLENRCDLLVAPGLDTDEARRAADAVLSAACSAYEGFEPGCLPVASSLSLDRLVTAGAERVRPYTQALWLAGAHHDFYQYIDDLYERRLRGRVAHPRRTT